MASPQRPLPEEPRQENPPELENLRTVRAQREVSSGWRFGFWWIWILIIAGIWYVGFGWGTSGGWIWGHHHAAATRNDMALQGPGVAILDASNKLPYVGQAFVIQNVAVQRMAGPQAYWVGSTFNSVPMLVVNASNGASPATDTGSGNNGGPGATPQERLDVTGRVMKAPAPAQAEQKWGLDVADANRLQSQGVYIQATEMQTVMR